MDDNKFLGCIGAVVSVVAIFVVAALTNGWALATLWGWFVAPTFEVPGLGIVQALGLSIIIRFLIAEQQEVKTERDKGNWERLLTAFFYSVLHPVIAVAVGWVIVQFM